jgi:ABC-type transporter Mla MlaB component
MTELLKITKVEGIVPILHFEGNIDGQTESLAVEKAREVFDSGARSLVIDMGGVEMVTSAGLRALHTIYKMFTPADAIQSWNAEHEHETFKSPYFVLAQPSSQVHYVLSIAGFLQSICIYPSMQEALDSFKS